MSTTAGDWYVSRGGERFGPVSFQDLIDAARTGRLEPRTDLVYGAGLSTWTPAGEIDGVFEKKAPVESGAAGQVASSDALADTGSYDFGQESTHLNLPGAGRLGYFLGITILPTLLLVGLSYALPQAMAMIPKDYAGYAPYLVFLPVGAALLVGVIVTVKRLQNLAMSGWWALGLFVPLLQWWVQYRLFACPPGYNFTGKLDGIGKFLAVIYWLALLAMLALPVLLLTGAAGESLNGYLNVEDLEERLRRLREAVPAVPAPK